LGVDLLPASFSERITESRRVFRQSLRIPAVAEALEKRVKFLSRIASTVDAYFAPPGTAL
jgi:hypothetical protein